MVWFRVGCCERCGGVGSRGERRSLGPKLTRYWAASPALMRGSGGTIPLGGRGVRGPGTGTYIYIYMYTYRLNHLYT